MGRNVVVGVFALILLGASATGVYGQDEVLGELYGRGVHSYFAGDHKEAFSFFSEAIKEGTRDPRCYYFRGLTFVKLGRPEASDEEFAAGAKLEATSEDLYPVSRSLQRVQGEARLSIEKHRRNARVAARRIQEARRRARYEALLEAEKEVLRKPVRRSPAAPRLPEGAADPTDPFANKKAPELPKPPAANNPVPAPPKPAAKPAADDPFGAAPAKPQGKGNIGKSLIKAIGSALPGGKSKDKAASDDPFGAKPAATDDPFGAKPAPSKKPAVDDDPFGAKPATDDPFGAKPAPSKKTAPSKKPAADDDPFGLSPAPAKKSDNSADDDPFK